MKILVDEVVDRRVERGRVGSGTFNLFSLPRSPEVLLPPYPSCSLGKEWICCLCDRHRWTTLLKPRDTV